jgi:hypothetical protein
MCNISPDFIDSLPENGVFVFGSNIAGRHGKGAAKLAVKKFGAQFGVGSGFCGSSYAIPTKDEYMRPLTLEQIEAHVNVFIHFARFQRPDLKFFVIKIGCGLAGYSPEDIAPLFIQVVKDNIDNIYLPKEFVDIINDLL